MVKRGEEEEGGEEGREDGVVDPDET